MINKMTHSGTLLFNLISIVPYVAQSYLITTLLLPNNGNRVGQQQPQLSYLKMRL